MISNCFIIFFCHANRI